MKTEQVIRAQAEQLANSAGPEYWKDLRKRQVAASKAKEQTDGQRNDGDSLQGD